MSEFDFQKLCCDLFSKEPNVTTCDIYGHRGEAQEGVDLLAYRRDQDGVELGQCKCYEKFSRSLIQKACDEFFRHWSRWEHENVHRFVLMVGSDLSMRSQLKEISKQKRRFADYGITFEAWSARTLVNKLAPHPGIVARFLDPAGHWVERICGHAMPTFSVGQEGGYSATIVQVSRELDKIADRLSSNVERRVAEIRSLARGGRITTALQEILEIRLDSPTWAAITPNVKGAILRLEASLRLVYNQETDIARSLLKDSDSINPVPKPTSAHVLLTRAESGPEAALNLFQDASALAEMNLKTSLLLELERPAEALGVLRNELPALYIEPDSESHRLTALAHLMIGDMGPAILACEKALESADVSTSVQSTAGIIFYFACLSSVALPAELVEWPEPLSWNLVRRDDESVARIRRAESLFKDVLETSEVVGRHRANLQAWRLACLSCDSVKRRDAERYCGELLANDPANYRAFAWAIARNYHIDLAPSVRELERRLKKNRLDVSEILALAALYAHDGRTRKALNLLKRSRPLAETHAAGGLWTLWESQILSSKGKQIDLPADTEDIPSNKHLAHAKGVALRYKLKKGDADALFSYADRLYQESKDGVPLAEACALAASYERWDLVADRADFLAEDVGTADAITLAALSQWNTGRIKECVDLLASHQSAFSSQTLPPQLRRIRILSYQRLGLLSESVAEAEELARQAPSTEHQNQLVQVLATKGDIKGAAVAARKLLDAADLMPQDALGIASITQLDDVELARSFWRKATSTDLDLSQVPAACSLGFRLGLDSELKPLIDRLPEAAETPDSGVEVVRGIDRILEMQSAYLGELKKAESAYINGLLPIHRFAEIQGASLARLYHYELKRREDVSDSVGALLVRYAAAPPVTSFPSTSEELHLTMDITALLLSAHLELLDAVESTFAPIRVSVNLPQALLRIRGMEAPHQPLRAKHLKSILNLESKGRLLGVAPGKQGREWPKSLVERMGERWVSLIAAAVADGGVLVDFLPLTGLHGNSGVELVSEWAGQVVNCRLIADRLRDLGKLSASEYDRAIKDLGLESRVFEGLAQPDPGSRVYLRGDVAEALASAGILDHLTDTFAVYVESEYLDETRKLFNAWEAQSELSAWMAALMERVRTGLDKGLYRALPAFEDSAREGPDDATRVINLDLLSLGDVLHSAGRMETVLWVDDRSVGRLSWNHRVRVATTLDVLNALVHYGAIDAADRFESLLRLRAARVLFLPAESAEFLHHLRDARVVDGAVVESRALAILRSYFSWCLTKVQVLLSNAGAGEQAEVPFIQSIIQEVAGAFSEIWSESVDHDTRRARSNWLWEAIPLHHVRGLPPGEEKADRSFLLSVRLSGLIVRGFSLRDEVRKEYLEWLYREILQPRFDAQPDFAASLASHLKMYLAPEAFQQHVGNGQEALVRRMLQKSVQELPARVRDYLYADEDFKGRLQVELQPIVDIGGTQFKDRALWASIQEVYRNGRVSISDLNGRAVTITIASDDRNTLLFQLPDADEPLRVADPLSGVFHPDAATRESFLRNKPSWFDCPQGDFDEAVSSIAVTQDPSRRVSMLKTWRDNSAEYFYEQVERNIAQNARFTLGDLVPSTAGAVCRNLRLDPDGPFDFSEQFRRAAEVLPVEEGLLASIGRLSGLPVMFPEKLLHAIAQATNEERRHLCAQWMQVAGSPISLVHMVRVLSPLGEVDPELRDLLRPVFARIVGEDAVGFTWPAFLAVLRWSLAAFERKSDFESMDTAIRLAVVWSHAHRIYSLLRHQSAPDDWIRSIFERGVPLVQADTFERDPERWLDLANPRHLRLEPMVTRAAAYAFGTDPSLAEREFIQQGVESLSVVKVGEKRFINPLLFRDHQRAPNALGSFLGRDLAEPLAQYLTPEESASVSTVNLEAAAARAVGRLSHDVQSSRSWIDLMAILGDYAPYPSVATSLSDAVKRINLLQLFRDDKEHGLTLLRFIVGRLVWSETDDSLRANVEQSLMEVARDLANLPEMRQLDLNPGKSSGDKLMNFVDTCLTFSIVPGDGLASARNFARLFRPLTEEWPNLGRVLRPSISALVDELPLDQVGPIGELLLELNALR